jgi:hypothetical protein
MINPISLEREKELSNENFIVLVEINWIADGAMIAYFFCESL